jgi:hypothetical protein
MTLIQFRDGKPLSFTPTPKTTLACADSVPLI